MYTEKIRTFLNIPIELFEQFFNSLGKNKVHRMIQIEQLGNEILEFQVAEIPISRARNKPRIGLHSTDDKSVFAFWYVGEADKENVVKPIKAQFLLIAQSIPLTEEQVESGEKIRYEIKFQTSPEGIDPMHLSAEVASEILAKAHDLLKNTKNYRRVIK
jgi:hypothetical protein